MHVMSSEARLSRMVIPGRTAAEQQRALQIKYSFPGPMTPPFSVTGPPGIGGESDSISAKKSLYRRILTLKSAIRILALRIV